MALAIGWPQGIYIALSLLTLAVTIDKTGQPKGNYSVAAYTFNALTCFGLLYWGGFFTN